MQQRPSVPDLKYIHTCLWRVDAPWLSADSHAGETILLPGWHSPHQVGRCGQFQRPAQLQVDRLPAISVRHHLHHAHLHQWTNRMFLSGELPTEPGRLHHQGKLILSCMWYISLLYQQCSKWQGIGGGSGRDRTSSVHGVDHFSTVLGTCRKELRYIGWMTSVFYCSISVHWLLSFHVWCLAYFHRGHQDSWKSHYSVCGSAVIPQ